MRKVLSLVFICWLIIALVACGGHNGSNSNSITTHSSSNSTTTPSILTPGTTITMSANSSVLVPAGTTITAPNGNKIFENGSDDTDYTPAGSIVSVPLSATGPADNLVTTVKPTSGNNITISANVTVIAGSATTNINPTDGTGTAAIFWGGGHLLLDSSDNIIVSDRGALRKVTQAGVVTTLLPGYSPADWEGIAIDSAGYIFGSGCPGGINISPVTWAASIYQYFPSGTVTPFSLNWETSTTNPSVGWGGLAVDTGGHLFLADNVSNRIVTFNSLMYPDDNGHSHLVNYREGGTT